MNYSVEEYARDIVYNITDVCDEERVPHPHIVKTEIAQEILRPLDHRAGFSPHPRDSRVSIHAHMNAAAALEFKGRRRRGAQPEV